MDKWEMYMEIHQLLKQGFSKVKITEKLNVCRTTIYRYINRNPETMSKWVKQTKVRRKKLDGYKDLILSWLMEHPDMSAAQVLDWLQEKYANLEVAESTVRLYIRGLRKEYDIPKETTPRSYEAVSDVPLGNKCKLILVRQSSLDRMEPKQNFGL